MAAAADACGDDVLRLVLRGGPPAWRAVCARWRAAYDDGAAHAFVRARGAHYALRPGNAYARLCDHHKAARLGFGHASVGAGARRHVVLWHPRGGGPCALFLRPGGAATAVRAELEPAGGERRRAAGRAVGRAHGWRTGRVSDAEEEGDECIKCGLRTTRPRCPDCGRPTWCSW